MPSKKRYLDADDLFEEEMGEPPAKKTAVAKKAPAKVITMKPKSEPKSKALMTQKQAETPAVVKPSRQHETYEEDMESDGSDDYKWSMEDTTTDTAKALEVFMGKSDLRKESELNERQIVACALLLETAGRYKLPRIRNAVHHFLACRVSKDRGSRQEAVNAFIGLVENRKINSAAEMANSLRREM